MSKKVSDYKWKTNVSNDFPLLDTKNLSTIKDLLNNVGPGFCLAKFKQVTMHLGTGMIHSCHHPTPHKVSIEEIQENPNALFNDYVLKTARQEMLQGKRPSECDYCWRIEDGGGNSDRSFKSLEPWAFQHHDNITNLTGQENIYPSYLEVSFSNACNLACSYCGPEFSSKWVDILKRNGPIKLLEGSENEQWSHGWQDLDNIGFRVRENNPYVDAFWKWFPDAYKHLNHYRITGGEPLMSKETFRSMQWFIDNPNTDLEFSINSNFSVPDKLWNKFTSLLKKMRDEECVKKITIYTSVEGWGKRAEYARHGLDFELFKSRTEEISAMGNVRVVIMSAFNIFSITSFKPLLEWVNTLKRKYNTSNAISKMEKSTGFNLDGLTDTDFTEREKKNPSLSSVVGIDIPYLRHPKFLDAHICSHEMVDDYFLPCMDYMCNNLAVDNWKNHIGFEPYEFEKLRRIFMHRIYFNKKIDNESEDVIQVNRAKFYEFVNKKDKANNTNFLETFPEMLDFYNLCKEDYNRYKNG